MTADRAPDRWPPGAGPRLLIADGWYANAGDGAIVLAMAQSIRRVLPGARMLFCAPHRALVEHHYPELAMTDPLHALAAGRSSLLDQADAVISKGGGHLFEHYSVGRRLAGYRAVRERGTPLAFWSQSVGWFVDDGVRSELGRALAAAALFVAREPETVENLEAMGIRAEARLSSDEALMLPLDAPLRPGDTIGVALNALAVARPLEAAQPGSEALVDTHADLVERLLAQERPVRACSTVQGFGELSDEIEDDAHHHRAIAERLPARARGAYDVVERFLPPQRLRHALRGLDVVVSSRMHVALLAMLENVPVVYVSENFKGVSIFRRLGLEALVVGDGDPGAVLDAIAAARSERATIASRLARLRREVRPTASAVVEALELGGRGRGA